MQQWEYKVVSVPDEQYGEYVEHLSEAGRDGWEFTGHTADTGHSVDYLMKRPSQILGNNDPKPAAPTREHDGVMHYKHPNRDIGVPCGADTLRVSPFRSKVTCPICKEAIYG